MEEQARLIAAVSVGNIKLATALMDRGVSPFHDDPKNGIPCAYYFLDQPAFKPFGFLRENLQILLEKELSKHSGYTHLHEVNSLLLQGTASFYSALKQPSLRQQSVFSIRKCVDYIQESLALRKKHGIKLDFPQPIAAYGNRKEVQTMTEFLRLSLSFSANEELAYQCLIIRERIFGYGEDSVIAMLLAVCRWFLEDLSRSSFASELLLRASEMILHRVQFSDDIPVYLQRLLQLNMRLIFSTSSSFLADFPSNMWRKLLSTNAKSVVKICKSSDNSFLIQDFLEVLHYLSENDVHVQMSSPNVLQNWRYISKTPIITPILEATPIFDLYKIFTTMKQDQQAKGNNCPVTITYRYCWPLHVAKSAAVVSLLIEGGAHLDAVDSQGKTAIQVNQDHEIQQLLKDHLSQPLNLSCLTARAIVNHGMPYKHAPLPTHIKKFISYHDPNLCYVWGNSTSYKHELDSHILSALM